MNFIKENLLNIATALVLVVIAVLIGLLVFTILFDRGELEVIPPPPATTTTVATFLSIEDSPVWRLEDDGSWTCMPGGPEAEAMGVCDGLEHPNFLDD